MRPALPARALFAWAVAGASAVTAVPARSEPITTIPISSGLSVSSNPFLREGAQAKSGQSVFLEAQPTIAWRTETSDVTLDGQVRVDRFLKTYRDDLSVRIGLAANQEVSERTRVRAHASARSARANGADVLLQNAGFGGPTIPSGSPEAPVLPDVSFGGLRGRTTTLEAEIGVNHAVDDYSALSFDLGTSLNRYKDSNSRDSRAANANATFQRRLSERGSLDVSLEAVVVDYLGRREGDGFALSPTLGWQQRLSSQTTFTVAAGLSLTRITEPLGTHDSTVSLAGRASLCSRGSRFDYCGRIDRSARPTSEGGLSSVLSAGVSGQFRLNRRDRIAMDASYGRSSEALLTGSRRTELAQASMTLSREFDQRLSAFFTPSYTKSFREPVSPKANFALRMGVRFRFGAIG